MYSIARVLKTNQAPSTTELSCIYVFLCCHNAPACIRQANPTSESSADQTQIRVPLEAIRYRPPDLLKAQGKLSGLATSRCCRSTDMIYQASKERTDCGSRGVVLQADRSDVVMK